MRLTRIYTRTGDKGDTGLAGGVRVPKDSDRIEAYGTVDELNSIVGIVRAVFPARGGSLPVRQAGASGGKDVPTFLKKPTHAFIKCRISFSSSARIWRPRRGKLIRTGF